MALWLIFAHPFLLKYHQDFFPNPFTGNELVREKFYFIHFEYLLYYEDEDVFYPAEVALAEYSIFSGNETASIAALIQGQES